MLFTSNNKILVDNWRYTPAIVCVQRSASKYVISDDLLRQSNKNGFGDEIGVTTNHITAMFDIQANYAPDSKEYQELDYRIQCGQLYQQAAIDRVKGIIANPMPKYWFTKQSEKRSEMTSLVNEMVGNEKLVQAFSYENRAQEKFDQLGDELADAEFKATFFSSLTNPSTRLINNIVYAGVAIVGSFIVITGKLTVGQLTCFLSYATQFAKPFNEISAVMT